MVSKRHISLHKDPIVEACLPFLKKKEIEEEGRKRQQMATRKGKATANKPTANNTTATKSSADSDELWKYLCDKINPDLVRPNQPIFERLMALPRIRDLTVAGRNVLTPKHLMRPMLAGALVVQVTGVERQVKQCTACRRGDGPFQECVSICPELALEIANVNPSLVTGTSTPWCCMNCVLNRCFERCSLKASPLTRLEDGTVKEKIPHWMVSSEEPPSPAAVVAKPKPKKATTSQEKDGPVADDEADKDVVDVNLYRQDETSFGYRRSGRIRLQAESSATPSAPQSTTQKRSFASTDMAASTSQVAVTVTAAREEENSSSLLSRSSKRLRGLQSLANVPPATIQESLRVDDWERGAKAISTPGQNGSSESKYFPPTLSPPPLISCPSNTNPVIFSSRPRLLVPLLPLLYLPFPHHLLHAGFLVPFLFVSRHQGPPGRIPSSSVLATTKSDTHVHGRSR